MGKDFDNEIEKEALWKRFSSIWADDYKNAIHILRIINSYPTLANLISKKPLQTEQTILNSQKCWIWLCSRFSNEIDTEFFKEYWVPIELDEYGIYMDLSEKSYPIFSIEYFWYEPYSWYKKFLFKNVQDLLLSPDLDIDIKEILKKNDKEK